MATRLRRQPGRERYGRVQRAAPHLRLQRRPVQLQRARGPGAGRRDQHHGRVQGAAAHLRQELLVRTPAGGDSHLDRQPLVGSLPVAAAISFALSYEPSEDNLRTGSRLSPPALEEPDQRAVQGTARAFETLCHRHRCSGLRRSDVGLC